MLYLTLAPDFQGTIVLPYRVTDGKLFSNTANATHRGGRASPVEEWRPQGRRSRRSTPAFPRGFYNGALLGAPGADPTLPSSVDLSKDFPLPGDQGTRTVASAGRSAMRSRRTKSASRLGWSLEPAEHRFSPAYIYNQLNGGRDNGVYSPTAWTFSSNQGVATLARMPYDDQDFLTQPSAAAHQEASQFKGQSWKTANGVLEIKDALANQLPVVRGHSDVSMTCTPCAGRIRCTTRLAAPGTRPACRRGRRLRRQPLRRSLQDHQFLGSELGRRRILLDAVRGGELHRRHARWASRRC